MHIAASVAPRSCLLDITSISNGHSNTVTPIYVYPITVQRHLSLLSIQLVRFSVQNIQIIQFVIFDYVQRPSSVQIRMRRLPQHDSVRLFAQH